jgi:hypothetical protein
VEPARKQEVNHSQRREVERSQARLHATREERTR